MDTNPNEPGQQPLSEGEHQAKVVVKDAAGNPSEVRKRFARLG